MANAAAYKTIDGFKNKLNFVDLEYDFANDTGATGTYSLGVADGNLLVHSALVYVETACTSGGSATVAVGSSTTDPDAFLDATSGAVANLTANAVLYETTQQCYVGDAETIDLVIATAALTAGKIKVKLVYEML